MTRRRAVAAAGDEALVARTRARADAGALSQCRRTLCRDEKESRNARIHTDHDATGP
jgi:hypothetical protein